jgi:hypothetical protein
MAVGHSELAQQVRAVLQEDSRTRDAAVDVVDEGGTVTLTGTVDTDDTRQVVEEIIEQQEGVIQVINELRIESDNREREKPVVAPPAHDIHRPFMGTRPEVLN